MTAVDHRTLAQDILEEVGGEDNLAALSHCATRLRLQLRDEAKANTESIEKLPGVLTVVQAGGQYQVVVGNDVALVYAELGKLARTTGEYDTAGSGRAAGGNVLNRFIELISSIFQPIIWALAGTGLLKAFLSLTTQLGWLGEETQTYLVLSAAADALFYFLPMFLAITAARRFGTSQVTSLAIAGALVYPSIVALSAASEPVSFLGLPVVIMNYTYSVIPIIVAVWLQGYLERFLTKILPSAIRSFSIPLVTILVMVPLILLSVGPLTIFISQRLSAGVNVIFDSAPWIAGAVLGGTYQVLVVFGLHWGLDPIVFSELADQGFSRLMGPLMAPVMAQVAATLAVLISTRNSARRKVAGPAVLTGFLAGVTEPAIYGVNLPLKKPFYFGIIGGAVGGAIAATGGSASSAYVFFSLLSLPAFAEVGSFPLQLLGIGVAMLIAFTLTLFFCPREKDAEAIASPPGDTPAAARTSELAPTRTAASPESISTGDVPVLAPVAGLSVTLTDVQDRVFASGAMGQGVGIVPSEGRVYAPISGTVKAALKSGHAFGIKSPRGVEVLVHIGIDTVQLDGRGFEPAVARGDVVKAGDLLAVVDLNMIINAGYDPTTLVIVTNSAKLTRVTTIDSGPVSPGATVATVEV